MNESTKQQVLPEERVTSKIFLIRGKKVMIDRDLAELYGVETKVLKQQVKRNIERFPEDFMFELNRTEFVNLRSHFVTSSWGGSRYLPMAFTEQGVAMLSSVLKSKQAILVNIQIIRVFTKMRELIQSHQEILNRLNEIEKKEIQQDKKILLIFEYLKQIEKAKKQQQEQLNRRRIGFSKDEH